MSELAALEIIEVDEWLDESIDHAACGRCQPTKKGSLVVAHCGVLYRLKFGIMPRPIPGTCEKCSELFGHCPKCRP